MSLGYSRKAIQLFRYITNSQIMVSKNWVAHKIPLMLFFEVSLVFLDDLLTKAVTISPYYF